MPGDFGGQYALAGFLYQIVGTLSIPAVISSANPPASLGEETDVHLTLGSVSDSVVTYAEQFNQDALLLDHQLRSSDSAVLVQFKYSSVQRPRKIGAPELRAIVEAFGENVLDATQNGLRITACVLVTNRDFTRPAKNWWDRQQNQEREYELRLLRTDAREWLDGLRGFAKRYGATEAEIDRGIERAIGRLVQNIGQQLTSQILVADLVEAFTGFPQAGELTIEKVRPLSELCLLDFARTYLDGDRWQDGLVTREVLPQIAQSLSERALVGLYGQGGCGKSVLLWQLLSQADSFCRIASADEVTDRLIPNVIHEWRLLAARTPCHDTADEAIHRLTIANPHSNRPVFWLGLDGLDEGLELAEQKALIRQILRWFWEKDRHTSGREPDARLIVTYRKPDELLDLLLLPDDSEQQPFQFPVGDFTEAETSQAAQRVFPELYRRLRGSVGPPFASPVTETLPGPNISAEIDAEPIDRTLFESLKHPAMWRAALRLTDEEKTSALNGDPQALNRLADHFLSWFRYKVKRRGLDLSKQQLILTLRAVANSTNPNQISEMETVRTIVWSKAEAGNVRWGRVATPAR